MPIFVALGKVTDAGMTNIGHLTARHEEAVKRAQRLGGRVISSYATMGAYDFVVTLDCPTMEIAMTILNREASGGNIRYETLTGMPTRDFARMFLDPDQLADEEKVLRRPRPAKNTAKKTAKTAAKKSTRTATKKPARKST
ncbi:MAG: Uncharacterized protein, contains GYD domain [Chloroflexi bacterium]|nr:MAG: Uncharacterized protein, contains GYD domain [Chloroflexota bacterium]